MARPAASIHVGGLKMLQDYFGIWEFPKLGVPYFGGPYNEDPTIQGTILGSPIFGNSHLGSGSSGFAVWVVAFQVYGLTRVLPLV